ncbi:MAG: hypothetical protein JSW40_03460 [Candidatus Omnitrophota bacterium]|nr:MAG: hypothetical protein JSW40_03460 [Candidatus Omnitrophota bacterium]
MKKIKIDPYNTAIRLLGIFVLVYISGLSMGAPTISFPLLGKATGLIAIGIFASGIGILFLKKWARYSLIILLAIIGLFFTYEIFVSSDYGNLTFVLIHAAVISCLFIPKIKGRFR